MEIKNTLNQLDPYRTQLKTEDAKAAQAKARADAKAGTATGAKGDRISLSPEAKLRTETFTAAMNAPEVRQAKVDAIKAQVESGEYQPDSKKIAAKLLREEPGLFRPMTD